MASKSKRCFIISPIGGEGTPTRDDMDTVREYIIDVACRSKGYETTRADDISEPGTITNQIIERLKNDELVIADLTENNPNVFYELAVRHCVQKPVILILGNKTSKIPFDVAAQRVIQYTLHPRDVSRAITDIQAQISAIESSSFTIDSPITSKILVPQKGEPQTDAMLREALSILRNVSGQVVTIKDKQEKLDITSPSSIDINKVIDNLKQEYSSFRYELEGIEDRISDVNDQLLTYKENKDTEACEKLEKELARLFIKQHELQNKVSVLRRKMYTSIQ